MLIVGEIDLSVGSMSGVASAILGVIWVNQGLPVIVAAVAALAVGAGVGSIYASLRTRLSMPSFVSTLSGLLALLGLQLYMLGSTGSINLPYDSGARRLRPALRDAGLALARAGADPGRRRCSSSGSAPWSSAAPPGSRPVRSSR